MSILKSSAVIFTPGKTQAAAIDPNAIPAAAATPRHALAWTTNIKLRPVDQDTVQWDAGSVKFSDNASQSVSATGSPKTLSPASNNGVWYVYKTLASSTLLFTQTFSSAIGSDRIQLGIVVVTADTNGMATVLIKGDAGGPHISAQSIAVNTLSAIVANLGKITSGDLVAVLMRTSERNPKLQFSSAGFSAIDLVGRTRIRIPTSGELIQFDSYGQVQGYRAVDPETGLEIGELWIIPVVSGGSSLNLGTLAKPWQSIRLRSREIQLLGPTRIDENLDMAGHRIRTVGDVELDSLTKDGSGAIQVNSNLEFGSATEIHFAGNEATDIGTDAKRARNIWANGAILDALALRENHDLAAQTGRSVLFVSGSGANAQLKIRHSNGTILDIPTPASTVVTPPSIVTPTVTLQADDASIASGGSVVLTWTSAMAVSVVINQGVGTVTPTAGGTKTVSPSSTRTYTITATSSTGHTATASVRITVGSTPPVVGNRPVINSFTGPASATSGASFSLSWSTSGATSVSINQGIGTVSSSGTRTVTLTTTTTYTLTATNSNGSRTSTVEVVATEILADPTIDSFDVQPRTGSVGDSVTISWSTTLATSVQVQRRAVAFAPFWSFLATDTPDGSRSSTLLRDAHYNLYATWRYRIKAIGLSGNNVNSSGITVSEA